MGKAKQKISQEGWRTTKKERRSYIIGDLGRTLEGYIVTAMMSTFMIFQGINMAAIAGVEGPQEGDRRRKIPAVVPADLFPVSHFYSAVFLYAERLGRRRKARVVLYFLSAV